MGRSGRGCRFNDNFYITKNLNNEIIISELNIEKLLKSTIKRRAPKSGYDNDVKNQYRKSVWSLLSKKVLNRLMTDKNAKVLLLPSKEGIEIDVAISFGIKPEQIIAIDENPQLLAHAKWKHKVPKQNRFGCRVSAIGQKIKDRGWYLLFGFEPTVLGILAWMVWTNYHYADMPAVVQNYLLSIGIYPFDQSDFGVRNVRRLNE